MELKLIIASVLALFILYSTMVNLQNVVQSPSSNIEGFNGGYELWVYRRGWKPIKPPEHTQHIHHHDYVWTNQRWKRKHQLRDHHMVYVRAKGYMEYGDAKKPVSSAEYEELKKSMTDTEKAAERARIMAADAQEKLNDVANSNAEMKRQMDELNGG